MKRLLLLFVFVLVPFFAAGCGGVVWVQTTPVVVTAPRPVVVYEIWEPVPAPSFEWTWSSHGHLGSFQHQRHHRHSTITTTTTTRTRTTTTIRRH